jgi:hypothetical protein
VDKRVMSGLLQDEATDRFPGESLLQTLAMAVIRAFERLNAKWPDEIPRMSGAAHREWAV